MKDNLKNQTSTVMEGAKTWHFWKVSIINASISSAATAGLTFLNNISAAGIGMDAGELISWQAFLVSMGIGSLIGIMKVLSTFKLPR